MFWILDMANNHAGSVSRAIDIIDAFAKVRDEHQIKAAIKLQWRQLDSFIHPDYRYSDLKYVKRFQSTKLSKHDVSLIVDHIRKRNFLVAATPFDNASLKWIEDFDVDILKIASCSVDDWPLLDEALKINKQLVISTAGASEVTLAEIVCRLKAMRKVATFMHCVAEYPTSAKHADLGNIDFLRDTVGDYDIGFSTHEDPTVFSLAGIAASKGCTIIEKHIDLNPAANAYSCTPKQLSAAITIVSSTIDSLKFCAGSEHMQRKILKSLKRGVYYKNDFSKGHVITKNDLFFAIPCFENNLDASSINSLIGQAIVHDVKKNAAVDKNTAVDSLNTAKVYARCVKKILNKANIAYRDNEIIELSMHYGIVNFNNWGAAIINRINRKYCKKLIIMLPGQSHPKHYHKKKEESFELLAGDCTLIVEDHMYELRLADPITIEQNETHEFSSVNGCVFEEVSTTHYDDDSYYVDLTIAKIPREKRKFMINI